MCYWAPVAPVLCTDRYRLFLSFLLFLSPPPPHPLYNLRFLIPPNESFPAWCAALDFSLLFVITLREKIAICWKTLWLRPTKPSGLKNLQGFIEKEKKITWKTLNLETHKEIHVAPDRSLPSQFYLVSPSDLTDSPWSFLAFAYPLHRLLLL